MSNKKSSAAAAQVETTVAGVKISKVSEAALDAYLKSVGLPSDGPIEARLQRLVAYTEKKVPEQMLADCDVCGGASDARLDQCPFCGTAGIPDGAEFADAGPEPVTAVKAAPKPAAKAAKAAPAPKPAPKPAKTAAAKKSEPAAAIVRAEDRSSVAAAPGLDKAVERVNDLKRQAVVSYWELGRAIYDIYEGRLYTQRTDDKGAPKYKSWTQFCHAELGMAPQHSYKLMDVAVSFTKDDVEHVGVAKLGIMLRLPPEERDKMLAQVKNGMPLSKVAQEVRKLAGGAPARDTGRKGFTGKRGSGRKAGSAGDVPKVGPDEVLAVVGLGRTKIPLFARPMKKGDQPARAMSLDHDPHGVEDATNDVQVLYRVVKEAKGLVLIVERRRAPKAKDEKPAGKKPRKG